MMIRIRSCSSAIILSVIICERRRSPFEGLASIMGLSSNPSWTSDESGQTNAVDKALVNSSACTITPSRDPVPVRSERPPARHCRASLPAAPVVCGLIPGIDGVIFRVSRHQSCLPAQIGPHLGIPQIRNPMLHWTQALCAQPRAARGHALLRGMGLCLLRGGHISYVKCYARKFNALDCGLAPQRHAAIAPPYSAHAPRGASAASRAHSTLHGVVFAILCPGPVGRGAAPGTRDR